MEDTLKDLVKDMAAHMAATTPSASLHAKLTHNLAKIKESEEVSAQEPEIVSEPEVEPEVGLAVIPEAVEPADPKAE